MEIEHLGNYLNKVAKEGYATGDENAWKKEKDGSTTITHQDGDFRMHDNYFGGEPYSGREVIFYNNKASWMMVYYGTVSENADVQKVYAFLRKALANTDENMPMRGPKELAEEEMVYKNEWQGNLGQFSGVEYILKNNKEVYRAKYLGGLVDQRSEN